MAPLQPEPAIRLAELFDRQQRFDEAIELYRKAIELEPESGQVHNNLGFILERTGRLADALRHYQAATEVDPGYALAYFNLADGLLAINRPAEAAETYRAGLELEPRQPAGAQQPRHSDRDDPWLTLSRQAPPSIGFFFRSAWLRSESLSII